MEYWFNQHLPWEKKIYLMEMLCDGFVVPHTRQKMQWFMFFLFLLLSDFIKLDWIIIPYMCNAAKWNYIVDTNTVVEKLGKKY